MDINTIKRISYAEIFSSSFSITLVSGIVMIETMSLISVELFNWSNLAGLFITAIMMQLLKHNHIRKRVLNYAMSVITFDCLLFIILISVSLYSLELRYIMMAVIFPFASSIVGILNDDIVHRHLSSDTLTHFRTSETLFRTVGNVCGFVFAIVLSYLDMQFSLTNALIFLYVVPVINFIGMYVWIRYDRSNEMEVADEMATG